MKHFLAFCFSLLIIVLASLGARPDYPGYSIDTVKFEKKSNYAMHTQHAKASLIAVTYSPGALPDRIQIPEPQLVSRDILKDSEDMEEDNLRLNALLYRDLEPDNTI